MDLTSPESLETLVVLDYGSQYTQLIVKRFRKLGAYAVILPSSASLERIMAENPRAVVLSGGPNSVYDEHAPQLPIGLLESGLPILAICYGMQLLAQTLGARVEKSEVREYGHTTLSDYGGALFEGCEGAFVAWMSHGDSVKSLPEGFELLASSVDTPIAAMAQPEKSIYALQFHPEVEHSPQGSKVLANFIKLVGLSGTWQAEHIVEKLSREVKAEVAAQRVLLAISGGVDSSTLGLLLHKAIGDKLVAVFVDHGLLREGERVYVEEALRSLGVNLISIDAGERFFKALEGVSDPERKRKIIGAEFIKVFSETAKELEGYGHIEFLAQGTLYPDVVESAGGHGAATIKSHHNVGGLPERLGFRLLEPFRTLFKDEVRDIARVLGMPESLVERHPFPGPGLAIRCLGEVTPEKVAILRQVDHIFISSLKEKGLYNSTWQALAVLTPIRTVGVMGDGRTYSYTAALRAVSSVDGMTADWSRLPYDFLAEVANRIVNKVEQVNRVVYDITSKPPATIEWE
ncbi:MAG: glutamine-hydrolyzing GMP synthase [Deinococcales bacterium]